MHGGGATGPAEQACSDAVVGLLLADRRGQKAGEPGARGAQAARLVFGLLRLLQLRLRLADWPERRQQDAAEVHTQELRQRLARQRRLKPRLLQTPAHHPLRPRRVTWLINRCTRRKARTGAASAAAAAGGANMHESQLHSQPITSSSRHTVPQAACASSRCTHRSQFWVGMTTFWIRNSHAEPENGFRFFLFFFQKQGFVP